MGTIKIDINPDGEKNVLIIAGVHGNELTAIHSVASMIDEFQKPPYINMFKSNNFIKSIKIMNGVNEFAIKQKTRLVEYDMNRSFKFGVDDITQMLMEEIKKHDIIFDVHSYHSRSLVKTSVLINNDMRANQYVKFCLDNKLGFILQGDYQKGTIKEYSSLWPEKIAFTIETKGSNKIDIGSSFSASYMIQKIITNINNDFFIEPNPLPKHYNVQDYYSPVDGLVLADSIVDFSFNTLFDFKRDFKRDDDICFKANHDYVNKGDYLYSIQPNIPYESL